MITIKLCLKPWTPFSDHHNTKRQEENSDPNIKKCNQHNFLLFGYGRDDYKLQHSIINYNCY